MTFAMTADAGDQRRRAAVQRERNAQTHRAAATTAPTHDTHIGMVELPICTGMPVIARATCASDTNPKITPEAIV
jgi:hypothetical protein